MTAFQEFLKREGACDEAKAFVAAHDGDFERSLRAALAEKDKDPDGKAGFAFGRFLRREAVARGWMVR